MIGLRGKLVVVTGGARGIGAAMAAGCRSAGADVIAVDAVAPAGGNESAAGIEQRRLDITDHAAVREFAAELRERRRPLDGLINNAAVSRPQGVTTFDERAWRGLHEVNLLGPVHLVHALLPAFAGRAAIVNVTSIRARRGFAGDLAYIAAKGGLEAATRSLAVELAPRAIRVNALAPGAVATDLNRAVLADPAHHDAALARIPLGRLGTPEDLAGAAVFLLSDAASFVTGTTLTVDGGQTARG